MIVLLEGSAFVVVCGGGVVVDVGVAALFKSSWRRLAKSSSCMDNMNRKEGGGGKDEELIPFFSFPSLSLLFFRKEGRRKKPKERKPKEKEREEKEGKGKEGKEKERITSSCTLSGTGSFA